MEFQQRHPPDGVAGRDFANFGAGMTMAAAVSFCIFDPIRLFKAAQRANLMTFLGVQYTESKKVSNYSTRISSNPQKCRFLVRRYQDIFCKNNLFRLKLNAKQKEIFVPFIHFGIAAGLESTSHLRETSKPS